MRQVAPVKLRGGDANAKPASGDAGEADGLVLPPHSYPASSIEMISWSPKAALFKNFLTPEECDYLIERATPKMEKSTVVDSSTGGSVPSEIRTSSGMFFSRCAAVKGAESVSR